MLSGHSLLTKRAFCFQSPIFRLREMEVSSNPYLESLKPLVLFFVATDGGAKNVPGVGVYGEVAYDHAPVRRAFPNHCEEQELRSVWGIVRSLEAASVPP